MPSGPVGSGLGVFRLDARAKVLLRDGEPLLLSPRQFDVFHVLVLNAGRIVSKDDLIKVAWHGQVVDDNNLEKVIAQLRERLDAAGFTRHIETVPRHGYRYIGPDVPIDAGPIDTGPTEAELDAELEPLQAVTNGRTATETIERPRIAEARKVFGRLVLRHAGRARAHIGLANTCILEYEATRTDAEPDTASLQCALEHARIARQLDPRSGEAWATLGFVLERTGARAEAVAALERAIELEPRKWRHTFRLATVAWGDARVDAAERTLARVPSCPLTRLLLAILFVARDALADAERELDAGLAAMADRRASGFAPVALHWLKGLLCLARGDDEEALAAFERELALEPRGHIYARECCAHTWYAVGACQLRRGDHAAARTAFEQAIARVSRHPMAHVGLRLLTGVPSADGPAGVAVPANIHIALARAAMLVASGDAPAAARVVDAALAAAPPGNAGWLVPIEPLLGVQRAHSAWTAVLATLTERAR